MARIAAVFVAIALLAAAGVQAHVSPSPTEFPAESYGMVALRVGHGCEGAPTTKVVIQIPEAMTAVKPRQMPGWDIKIKVSTYANPTVLHGENVTQGVGTITFTGELPDEYFQTFDLAFKLRPMDELDLSEAEMPSEEGLRPVYIPVSQYCKSNNGSHEWVEVPVEGEPEPESPAPVIYVNEELAVAAHGRRRR